MSVLLTNASFELLSLFWAIALSFLSLSFVLCLGMVLRRMYRNRTLKRRGKQKIEFRNYVINLMNEAREDSHYQDMPPCHTEDMTDIFLNYFQTLRGKKKETLQDLIANSELEARITSNTTKGTRGARMRAVRILSYLNTQTSLQVIYNSLSSKDKYVRLTAMRSLVKRKAIFFLEAIIESCLEAFPTDYGLLSGIISGFGDEIVDPLESLIRTSQNDVLITASLETLTLMMPTQSSIDFDELMKHESPDVRASALSLSAITQHEGSTRPLLLGLKDEAVQVKIRAAKTLNTHKRADLTSELFELTTDPILWVRYWAFRGIWVSGQSGQQLVMTMAKTNPMAENVAKEMSSGYV